MGLITGHWSGSDPNPEGAYHLEFWQRHTPIPQALIDAARNAKNAQEAPWNAIFEEFLVKKSVNFDTAMSYGTFMWNHDFRDGSPNIEIAAMCMGGPHVGTQNWGEWPYTPAHAWMQAYLMAVVAHLKNIHPLESFAPIDGYMNGPLYSLSTHGERAYQTANPPIDTTNRGYGLWGQDPDCRWDLLVVDANDTAKLKAYATSHQAATDQANWFRKTAADIQGLRDFQDHWNLSQHV